MVEALDNVFEDSIPDIYDRYLVPLILKQHASYLAHIRHHAHHTHVQRSVIRSQPIPLS